MELKEVIQNKLHEYKICLDSQVEESKLPKLKALWQLYTSAGPASQDVNSLESTINWLITFGDDHWKKNKNIFFATTSFGAAIRGFESDNLGVCVDSLLAVANALGMIDGIRANNSRQAKLRNISKFQKEKRETIRMYRELSQQHSPPKAAELIELELEKKYGSKPLKFNAIYQLILKHNKILNRINTSSGLGSRSVVHELQFALVSAGVNAWAKKNMSTNQEEIAEAVRMTVDEMVETEVLRMVDDELFTVK